MGVTVSLAGTLPKSYGRPLGTATDSSVFADSDSDGKIDKGGNLYAVRQRRARVVNPASTGTLASPYAVEEFRTYNQYGQLIFHLSNCSCTGRLRHEWITGNYDATTNPYAGTLKLKESDTNYTANDVNLTTGVPNASPSGSGLALKTLYDFDSSGDLVGVTSPRGFKRTITRNNLGLVTKVTEPAPFAYETKFSHDGDNNVVKIEVQNVVPSDLDDNGIQDSSSEQYGLGWFTHTFKYNHLNVMSERSLDATGSTPSTLTTTFELDGCGHVVRLRKPTGNVDEVQYDERGLVFKVLRGTSDITASGTTTINYDANGNPLTIVRPDTTTTTLEHDLFDRPTKTTDPIGNSVERTYDVASLVRTVLTKGQSKAPTGGDVTTTVLAQQFADYDELGRIFQSTALHFDVVNAVALAGGTITLPTDHTSERAVTTSTLVGSLCVYDDKSRLERTIDSEGHAVVQTFDNANRLTTVTDAVGNVRTYTYDKDSNVIRTTEFEKNQSTGGDKTFYTEFFFDELDRLIASVSPTGRTYRYLWDSREDLVQSSDAMGTVSGSLLIGNIRTAAEHGTFPIASLEINARGNTVRRTYDGLSRLLQTARDLREPVDGSGTVIDTITTSQTWDGNGRLTSQGDDNGNATQYLYDHCDRRARTVFADGTYSQTVYNPNGTVELVRDPRGVVTQYTYDSNGRPTDVAISNVPQGQAQTTFLAYTWDGLDRLKKAEDNDTITAFNYDSLSRKILETQTIITSAPRANKASGWSGITRNVKSTLDATGNRSSIAYPYATTPSFTLDFTYDAIDRIDQVKQGATTVADYAYIGPGHRVMTRSYANGTTSYRTYDDDRQVTRLDHRVVASGQRVRGFEYAWDRAGNRRTEQRLNVNTNTTEATGPGEFAAYDSVSRLVRFRREVATAGIDAVLNNKVTVTEPTSTKVTDYALDGVNNRTQTITETATTGYAMQYDGATRDYAQNQTTVAGTSWFGYDAAGNQTTNGTNRYFWDYNNSLSHLVTATDEITYGYDALGRRISKRSVGGAFTTVLYWWDGWRTLEETDASGNLMKRFVYGNGIDEVLTAYMPDAADVDGDSNTTEFTTLYYHENSIGSFAALTRDTGAVVEAYRYDAYGELVEILGKTGSVVAETQVKNPYLFQGARRDFEEGANLMYFRNRHYSATLGRFLSRDPLGVWGDPSHMGNGQSAFGNNPLNFVDPLGLWTNEGVEKVLAKSEIGRKTLERLKVWRKLKWITVQKVEKLTRRYRERDVCILGGYHTWSDWMEDNSVQGLTERVGLTHKKISIVEGLSDEEAAATLVHEASHAFDDTEEDAAYKLEAEFAIEAGLKSPYVKEKDGKKTVDLDAIKKFVEGAYKGTTTKCDTREYELTQGLAQVIKYTYGKVTDITDWLDEKGEKK